MKPNIFFVICLSSGSYEELLLIEVKLIPSISDPDLEQLINYMLPKVSKQGNAVGLFLSANNAMLVKLHKQMIENKPVIGIWRKKIPMLQNVMPWLTQILSRCANEFQHNIYKQ